VSLNKFRIYPGTSALIMLTGLLLLPVGNILAEGAPPPITIEADEATLQEQDGASIYRGHVVLIQGGLRFDADEVRVESVDGKLSRMIASGTPVKYKQKKNGQKSISAEATSIEYLASTSKAIFRGNAKLTQGANSFSGEKIEYDASTDTVKAGSSKSGGVKIVIQPNGVIAPQVKKPTESPNVSPLNDGNSTANPPLPSSSPAAGGTTDSPGARGPSSLPEPAKKDASRP